MGSVYVHPSVKVMSSSNETIVKAKKIRSRLIDWNYTHWSSGGCLSRIVLSGSYLSFKVFREKDDGGVGIV